MNNRNDILTELETLSPLLAGIDKSNPFTVPAGYFTSLTDSILEKTIYLPSFSSIDKNPEAQVPQGYFDTLSSEIIQKIKAAEATQTPSEELRKLSPLLYTIQSEKTYQVPAGYFASLPAAILSKVQPAETGRVIGFTKRSVWQYAAAAVITGMIAVSSLWLINKKDTDTKASTLAYEKNISPEVKSAEQLKNESEITAEIAKLPEDAIISYLQTTGTDQDLELLANTINEKDLPEQNQYLLDEETLNKFLEDINSKNN